MPSRIDVHAHYLPDFYREALIKAGKTHPDGMPGIPEWSEAVALETMDKLRISKALLSISSPGIYFGDAQAAKDLARRVNDEGARLCCAHPQRFGLFASTPLPDVASAIQEAKYALDTLHADGIVVESNHNGMYLGDARLNPFYEVLNEHKAVLFIHPSSPSCAGCGSLTLGYPAPMLEFMFETTRTVSNMILAGVTVRYPDIRVIVPHGGAALSVLASRVDLLMPFFETNQPEKSPSLRTQLRRLYYDLAGAPLPELLQTLLSIADPAKLLYGSDWPFTQVSACLHLAQELDASDLLKGELLEMIMSSNAKNLIGNSKELDP